MDSRICQTFTASPAKPEELPILLVDEIETTIDLIRCYIKGTYRQVPVRIIIAALGAIIYLVSPIDLIPDVIPIVGWLDDAAVITAVLGLGLGSELKKFRKWRDGTIDEQLDDIVNEYKKDAEGWKDESDE